MDEEHDSPSAADAPSPKSVRFNSVTTVGQRVCCSHKSESYLERFADSHTPCPSVLTSRKIGTHIHAIDLTELESYTPAAGGKEVIGPEALASAGRYFANPTKPDKSESLGERQTVF